MTFKPMLLVFGMESEHPVIPQSPVPGHGKLIGQLLERAINNLSDSEPGFKHSIFTIHVCRAIVHKTGMRLPKHADQGLHLDMFSLDGAISTSVGLADGGRHYPDHYAPEYCTPDVNRYCDLALAMDRSESLFHGIGAEATVRWREYLLSNKGAVYPLQLRELVEATELQIFRAASGGNGTSMGTHLNTRLPLETVSGDYVWEVIAKKFPSLAIAAQLLSGTGKLGIEYYKRGVKYSDTMQFQFAQRADFIERVVGAETTMDRPIVNTRNEPLGGSGTYRYHHIALEPSRIPEQTYMLSFFLTMYLHMLAHETDVPHIDLDAEVDAMHEISRSSRPMSKGGALLTCKDGQTITALELLEFYVDAVIDYANRGDHGISQEEVDLGTRLLRQTVDDLHKDWTESLLLMSAAKWRLLEMTALRHGGIELDHDTRTVHFTGNDPEDAYHKLKAIDLGCHRVDEPSLFDIWNKKKREPKLREAGFTELVDAEEGTVKPRTRAAFRAKQVELMQQEDEALAPLPLDWQNVVIRDEYNDIFRIRLPDDVPSAAVDEIYAARTGSQVVDIARNLQADVRQVRIQDNALVHYDFDDFGIVKEMDTL